MFKFFVTAPLILFVLYLVWPRNLWPRTMWPEKKKINAYCDGCKKIQNIEPLHGDKGGAYCGEFEMRLGCIGYYPARCKACLEKHK